MYKLKYQQVDAGKQFDYKENKQKHTDFLIIFSKKTNFTKI